MGKAALLAGHQIADVVCRSGASALAATRFIGSGTPQASSNAALGPADLVLISTQDDRITMAVRLIRRCAAGLSASDSGQPAGNRRGPITILHTSGALSSQILRPLRQQGFLTGSCHPLQTFESAGRSLGSLRHTYFCIEGDSQALRIARKMVRDIGGRTFEIPTARKELYHAGAVLASGGLTALLSISLEILSLCGLREKDARRVLFPLIEGTIANIKAVGPARALTGPIRRHDTGTIRRNTRALAATQPDWARIYRLLAKRSLSLLS